MFCEFQFEMGTAGRGDVLNSFALRGRASAAALGTDTGSVIVRGMADV
jgi:hypothetical protein